MAFRMRNLVSLSSNAQVPLSVCGSVAAHLVGPSSITYTLLELNRVNPSRLQAGLFVSTSALVPKVVFSEMFRVISQRGVISNISRVVNTLTGVTVVPLLLTDTVCATGAA